MMWQRKITSSSESLFATHLLDTQLPYCRHIDHWPASGLRIPLHFPSPLSNQKDKSEIILWISFVALKMVTRWQYDVGASLPSQGSRSPSSCLGQQCLVRPGQCPSGSDWHPPQQQWGGRSKTVTTATVTQNQACKHNNTVKGRFLLLPLSFSSTHIYKHIQAHWYGIIKTEINYYTSLFQLSWGTCLITWRNTQILSEWHSNLKYLV